MVEKNQGFLAVIEKSVFEYVRSCFGVDRYGHRTGMGTSGARVAVEG